MGQGNWDATQKLERPSGNPNRCCWQLINGDHSGHQALARRIPLEYVSRFEKSLAADYHAAPLETTLIALIVDNPF